MSIIKSEDSRKWITALTVIGAVLAGFVVYKFTNQIDVVKISTSMLKRSRELVKGRHGLTGAFESDIISQNKPNSLMMESVNGNIELMEAM